VLVRHPVDSREDWQVAQKVYSKFRCSMPGIEKSTTEILEPTRNGAGARGSPKDVRAQQAVLLLLIRLSSSCSIFQHFNTSSVCIGALVCRLVAPGAPSNSDSQGSAFPPR
jgi:hypothetical protein